MCQSSRRKMGEGAKNAPSARYWYQYASYVTTVKLDYEPVSSVTD
jgi:hypothetical protein